jgi:hypothetical protein
MIDKKHKASKPELKDVSDEVNADLQELLAAIDTKIDNTNKALDDALEILRTINKKSR